MDHNTANMLRGISDAQIIWGANHFSDILPRSSCWLVWDKDNTGDYADCELAWTSFPRAVRRFRWRWNGMLQQDMANKEYREHPTQKPVPLMRWCLSFADGVILDPYLGSGPSLRAAKDLGRRAIGIEIEERYCEIAARRLDQEVLAL
jgi:DNA modification methylase